MEDKLISTPFFSSSSSSHCLSTSIKCTNTSSFSILSTKTSMNSNLSLEDIRNQSNYMSISQREASNGKSHTSSMSNNHDYENHIVLDMSISEESESNEEEESYELFKYYYLNIMKEKKNEFDNLTRGS